MASVPQAIWEHDEVAECVCAYLAGTGGLTDIYTAACRMLRLGREVARHILTKGGGELQGWDKASTGVMSYRLLNEYETARERAYAAYRAKVVGLQDDVRGMRQDLLGGRLLTSDEALAFVLSPALRCFSLDQCREWGIALTDHVATILHEGGGDRRWVVIAVQPAGIIRQAEGDANRVSERALLHTNGQFAVAQVWPGSVIDHVQTFARKLAQDNYWGEMEALHFLLTGAQPSGMAWRHSNRYQFRNGMFDGEITLRLVPWLSGETVLRIYRAAQGCMIDGRPAQVHPRNLHVFQFVVEQSTDEGYRPSWRQLTSTWNNEYPDERYGDFRLFRRDFYRAKEHLESIPNHLLRRFDEGLRRHYEEQQAVANVANNVAKHTDIDENHGH